MTSITTIQLEQATKKKLERFKASKRETFDEVVNRLIRVVSKTEKELLADKMSSYLLSEKSLAKDWLSKEEDDAWKDL
ncbi:MAG TPA: DUF2281 domain-containing protein [Candidatus Diapherotrites archaeon]|uniref:DUF2281 domain-containing protein n=1 Tax=Candidatus Iainarchaeum sp. TaxID=3101447 RepID=A0A7J4JHD5_9ARCH|nr:DUF2281 domain-containing protein [Candidatus Diapherotrites archaeon]HIH17172.1 DUF2281 domain-containing protein [Candidatus Diapherotrites archaeon]